MSRQRSRALLGLLLFVVGTLGVPAFDAWLLHDVPQADVAHVESPDTDCHAERCVLGAPTTPGTPADPPITTGRLTLAFFAAPFAVPSQIALGRFPGSVLGSRAPPVRS